jgi:hypothetical protein
MFVNTATDGVEILNFKGLVYLLYMYVHTAYSTEYEACYH